MITKLFQLLNSLFIRKSSTTLPASTHSLPAPIPLPSTSTSLDINAAGVALITEFEGCKTASYKDIAGIWTIGYGSTGPDIVEGMVWTRQQCFDRFQHDLNQQFCPGVAKLVKVPVTSNQFSAVVCLAYNIGLGALSKSTMLARLNEGKFQEAADAFLLFNKARINGTLVPVAGLQRRRAAERSLFLLK